MKISGSNRFGLDYRAEAARLGPPPVPIIDGHAHINGAGASALYREVMDLFGVERVVSQTQIAEAESVRGILGDRVDFVAIPEYMAEDKAHAFTHGFLENVDRWADEFGARCVKLWNAPRFRDFARAAGVDEMWELDSPWRLRVAERAVEKGMMLMAHVADPDTWFATKYADASRYGVKRDHYAGLERMLARFEVPFLVAHMGGWPEDLGFIADLLERWPRLFIDTSATKWMVRELSKHPRDELLAFLERFSGRVMFGSDIVTLDDHLSPAPAEAGRFAAELAGGEAEAFDLYASRYYALRSMWETGFDGESPIADPDLAMGEPERHDESTAPRLVGRSLPRAMLEVLYRGAAEATMLAWYAARR